MLRRKNRKNEIFKINIIEYRAIRSIWADGGRFDIGPNLISGCQRDAIFMGKWSANKTGEYSVKIISPVPNIMRIELKKERVSQMKHPLFYKFLSDYLITTF